VNYWLLSLYKCAVIRTQYRYSRVAQIEKMTQKRSIIIVIFASLLCLVLLWGVNRSSDDAEQRGLNANPEQNLSEKTGDTSALLIRDASLNEKLAERFRLTVGFIEKGQNERAIAELNEIIRQQPNAIEPYINLAAVYAKSNDIDRASKTLIKAIDVNKNTSVLFKGLQKVYAAQAALAYQSALEVNVVNDDLAVSLPVIDSLMIDKPNNVEQGLISTNEGLQQQLDDNVAEMKALRQSLAQALKEKNELVVSSPVVEGAGSAEVDNESAELLFQQKAQLEIDELKKEHAEQLNELQTQFDTQVLALQRQIDLQTAMLVEVDLKPGEVAPASSVDEVLDTKEVAVNTEEPVVKQPELVQVISPEASDNSDVEDQKNNTAINLVKAWARSWAAQDVDTYVSHYEANFRPNSGLSNQKWREQRQVRLTNKSFINVNVDDFVVEEQGDQFSVTFSQHYKSNNVDDTITKRLVFKKKSDDWSQAKIVQEQVVSS